MTLRERWGVGGLVLIGAGALLASFVVKPFVPPAMATDTDSDGLSDSHESALGTNPNSNDSDGDGLNDWDEVFVHGTDPNDADSDNDGVNDGVEVNTNFTDPLYAASWDGGATQTGSYSSNLTRPAWTGTSAVDGNDVEVATGNFSHSMAPLAVDPGYGPAMPFVLTYNSGISYDGPWGKNVDCAMSARISVLGSGDVDYFPGDGWKYAFAKPSGSPSPPFDYTSPSDGIYWLLTKNVDGTHTLKDTHGNAKTFDSGGKMTSEADRFQNAITYSYTSGLLTGALDATGHSFTIAYYGTTNRVNTVTDGNGRQVVLEHNVYGELANVRSPVSTEYTSGRYWRFTYSNGSSTGTLNANMVRAKDPKGQVWLRNEFDENDRVVKQYLVQDPLSLSPGYFTFSYVTASSYTTVIDPEGNQRDWAWSGVLPTSLKEYSNRDVRSGDPTYWQTTFGHDGSSLRTKVVYPEGNRIDTDYDGDGNVTEVRRKATDTDTDNNTNDVYETFGYSGDYNLMTSHTDAEGNTTTYGLEDSGGLTGKVVETITHPTVTYLTPDQTATETFTYNSQGQMLTHTDGEGKVVEYQYVGGSSVKKGYLEDVIVDPGSSPHLALTTTYSTNDWGARLTVTNPRGYTTTHTVNEYGWVTKTETGSPQGYETEFVYDANGNLAVRNVENVDKNNTRDTDNPWFTTSCEYDALDSMLSKSEEVSWSSGSGTLSRIWQYEYTKNSKLKTLTKPAGNKVRYVYDERDLVYTRTRGYDSAVASTDTSAYDGNRNLVEWKNGRNKTWTHVYDDFDRRIKSVNPLGHYSEWIHDKGGHVTESKRWQEDGATDVLMEHTKRTYDERDRPYLVERGLKGTSTWSFLATTTEYDKRNLVTKVTDPRSKATNFEYDAAGRQTVKEDALGDEVRHFYDANGNVTKIDAICTSGCSTMRTGITEYVYDELDRVEQMDEVNEENDEDRHTWTYAHDSLSVKVEQVDPEDNTTTWTHDCLGRVLEESIDLGSSASKKRSWGYDLNDRLVSHKDDANNETTWTYNARDLDITETYADSGVKDMDYDAADNLTQWIDPNGTQVDLTWDDNNRNTAKDITLGSGVGGTTEEDMTYDALDRLTEAKDNDVTVQLTYDSLSRKKSEASGPNPISSYGKTTSYAYDDAGNVTRIDYPDGSFYVTRTYDDVNRLTLVEDGSSNDIVAIDFDDMTQRLEKYTFQNGTTTNFAYDGFGRVTGLDHKTSAPTTFAGYDMAYDKVGNMVYEEWSHDSGKGHNYSYDKAYRLKKTLQVCNDPSAEHASPGSQAYATKLEHNLSDDSDRTSVVTTPYGSSASTVNYTSNAVHEYTVVGGTNRSYDDNGNLIDDGIFTYTYDYRSQLLTVTRTSNSHVEGTYEHDALGRRTKKTVYGGASVRYYHDGVHEIEEYDGSTLLRKYVYRRDIDSIAMMEAPDVADVDNDANTSELARLFYHYDARGNVARLTASAQAVVESYESDPYGNVSFKDKTGSGVSTTQVGNSFVFQRRRHDDESGLMYFRARMYDSARGHWLQRDPLGLMPGPNWHEFVESNPVSLSDPMGLWAGVVRAVIELAKAASRSRTGPITTTRTAPRLGPSPGTWNKPCPGWGEPQTDTTDPATRTLCQCEWELKCALTDNATVNVKLPEGDTTVWSGPIPVGGGVGAKKSIKKHPKWVIAASTAEICRELCFYQSLTGSTKNGGLANAKKACEAMAREAEATANADSAGGSGGGVNHSMSGKVELHWTWWWDKTPKTEIHPF